MRVEGMFGGLPPRVLSNQAMGADCWLTTLLSVMDSLHSHLRWFSCASYITCDMSQGDFNQVRPGSVVIFVGRA